MRDFSFVLFVLLVVSKIAFSGESKSDAAERGFRFLTEKAYLPSDFDQETFDNLWKVWPQDIRDIAEACSAEQRRKMAFERYGLTLRPGDDSKKPIQYVVDDQGMWTMNCFACHAGQILGQSHPGLPNSNYALETLTEDSRKVKLMMKKPLSRMDLGLMVMPLGKTNGTTNAVMFGVALRAYRDDDLNVFRNRLPPRMVHHDMDAPPWWHFKRKHHIYIDGFAEKSVRGLMQFMMVEQNGPEKFREWESDFKNIYEYISSVEPPKYPFAINQKLAERGRAVFNQTCADCHGTYGDGSEFPNVMVPWGEVQTDAARFESLTPQHRASYHTSWFANYGAETTIEDPSGYVAPPLDGIWASAPYFHNGSVPTLWHVLNPSIRPEVWKRSYAEYDKERVGLDVDEFAELPKNLLGAEKRAYFDASKFGKSRTGHDFPNQLTNPQKSAVLEYLKTL